MPPASSAALRFGTDPTATSVTSLSASMPWSLSDWRVAESDDEPKLRDADLLALEIVDRLVFFWTSIRYGDAPLNWMKATVSPPPTAAPMISGAPMIANCVWLESSAAIPVLLAMN